MNVLISCSPSEQKEVQVENQPKSEVTILLSQDIEWEKLNPARGDQSPQAGTIWGDQKETVPTGFLAKFVDGFSSPPHIHNVTYRAVVIAGEIHNDDPKAENMWMPPGSFWTQPEGEAHITSAKGEEVMALVEIDQGPYLVKPTEKAYDNGERPINIDASNVVWLSHENTSWIQQNSTAQLSFLLENNEDRSLFVKLPPGYSGKLISTGSVFHAVIISGELEYAFPEITRLDPGSYFGSAVETHHQLANNSHSDVVVYVRTNGAITIQ